MLYCFFWFHTFILIYFSELSENELCLGQYKTEIFIFTAIWREASQKDWDLIARGDFTISLQLSCSKFVESQSCTTVEKAQSKNPLPDSCRQISPWRGLVAMPHPADIPGSHRRCWAALWPPMAAKDWVLLIVLKDPVIYWAITPCSWHCSWPSFLCYDTSYSHRPPNCLQGLQFIPVTYSQPLLRELLLHRPAFSIPFVAQKQQEIRNKGASWFLCIPMWSLT